MRLLYFSIMNLLYEFASGLSVSLAVLGARVED